MPSGPGFIDSNGVWVIGEDDIASPITDQLRKPGDSIGTILTALRAKLVSIKTGTQTMTTGTLNAVVAWDSSPIHTFPGITWNTSTGLGVCVTAGLYKVHAQLEYATNGTGVRVVGIQKATAAFPTTWTGGRFNYQGAPSTSNPVTVYVQDFVQLAVGDVLRIVGEHTAGANLNLTNAQLEVALA